jgi:hypothetical protein
VRGGRFGELGDGFRSVGDQTAFETQKDVAICVMTACGGRAGAAGAVCGALIKSRVSEINVLKIPASPKGSSAGVYGGVPSSGFRFFSIRR